MDPVQPDGARFIRSLFLVLHHDHESTYILFMGLPFVIIIDFKSIIL